MLAAVVLATFFTGAYAIAEAVVNGLKPAAEDSVAAAAGGGDVPHPDDYGWHQKAAVYIFPLLAYRNTGKPTGDQDDNGG